MTVSVVTLADPEEELEVEMDGRDQRAAEVAFPALVKAKGAPVRQIIESHPLLYTAWVAWHAATRAGATSLGWVEWERRVLTIESETPEEGEGSAPGPTSEGP